MRNWTTTHANSSFRFSDRYDESTLEFLTYPREYPQMLPSFGDSLETPLDDDREEGRFDLLGEMNTKPHFGNVREDTGTQLRRSSSARARVRCWECQRTPVASPTEL